MPSDSQKTYELLCENARQTALLTSIESLLGWDERCIMPLLAGEYRAEQMTLMSGMIHDRQTDPRLADWLSELAGSPLAKDPGSETGATIRQLKRQYEKKVKLPKALVVELTRVSVLGQQVWQEARQKNDFAPFQPLLEQTIRLKQEQAAALGFEECAYDALLDEYEQGEKTSNVRRILQSLRGELVPLVAEIRQSKHRPDTSILAREFPVALQQSFGQDVAGQIGFDFQRGRLDVTAHPFCTGMGPHDHRITTRYDRNFFNSGFFGILHEAGHGLYEQGLRPDQYGLPLGEAISLGIHESQSRLWENLVGRSHAFWQHAFPAAQKVYASSLADVRLDDFYFAINDVRPSLIRVEADEATYNLHILIRFELEQALLDGELSVADLPAEWNSKYREALGISPKGAADGVLQDIHWSAGLFGYFATYSLGNLYAAQFFAQADRELGGLSAQFARGEFEPLRNWLTTKIYGQGQRYTAAQLVQQVTGQPLSAAPFMSYLRGKLAPLYGL
jgi:carboxypeptidase Taq